MKVSKTFFFLFNVKLVRSKSTKNVNYFYVINLKNPNYFTIYIIFV